MAIKIKGCKTNLGEPGPALLRFINHDLVLAHIPWSYIVLLSFGQMFIRSIGPETPTTLRLSIAIGSWQHFPAFYLPCISFSSSDFFLYLKVDNFQYVLLLVAHWEFSVLLAGKKSRSIKDQDKDLVPSGYLLKTITFVLTEVQWRSANPWSQNNTGETKIKVLSVSLTIVSYQTGH